MMYMCFTQQAISGCFEGRGSEQYILFLFNSILIIIIIIISETAGYSEIKPKLSLNNIGH